jgi:hypothetical protein
VQFVCNPIQKDGRDGNTEAQRTQRIKKNLIGLFSMFRNWRFMGKMNSPFVILVFQPRLLCALRACYVEVCQFKKPVSP